jgi:ABC-type nickel/cobalt efflux system permease component RcnA
VAAIAGGVVGGVAGLALVFGLGWWFIRRKRRTRQERHSTGADEEDESPSKHGQEPSRSMVEADAGPDSVLVESDAHPVKPRVIHELQA